MIRVITLNKSEKLLLKGHDTTIVDLRFSLLERWIDLFRYWYGNILLMIYKYLYKIFSCLLCTSCAKLSIIWRITNDSPPTYEQVAIVDKAADAIRIKPHPTSADTFVVLTSDAKVTFFSPATSDSYSLENLSSSITDIGSYSDFLINIHSFFIIFVFC